jgi:DNA-binding beta-propeller fold protein YncE
MKRPLFALLTFSCIALAKEAPLKLIQTFRPDSAIKGHFDHLAADLVHNRLFLTAEDNHSVVVLDLQSGTLVHTIKDILRPHAILYRADLNKIYVTDGGEGNLKVYDGETYRRLAVLELLKDADSIGYDPSTGYLYIDNGGGDVGASYSMFSTIDSAKAKKIADLRIDGDTLEAMRLDEYRPRIYINNKAKNEITVVDRWQGRIVNSWPVTMGKTNVALGLDEAHQRLFVGCRSGQLVVFDTNIGKELAAVDIPKGVDDLAFDRSSKRLYASGDGSAVTFSTEDPNHPKPLGTVTTGPLGRTALLVPELSRYYVAVPALDSEPAAVLVFETTGVKRFVAKQETKAYDVHAPLAERLVRETLSAHPDLRKMGLHAIKPGESESVIIANGNATRIGIPTTPGDFAAVKDGNTYCKSVEDGAYYNLKMPISNANHEHIGILVMEIPYTSASSQNAAINMAESIRSALAARIPSIDQLFGSN